MFCMKKCRWFYLRRIFLQLLLIKSCCLAEIYDDPRSFLDDNDDDKPVFDRLFSDEKTFHLDDCIPLAFGDFNADKIIDIFCRNTLGNTIRVMLNDDRSPQSKEQYSVVIPGFIYDALAGDYDGDSKLDLFVIYKINSEQLMYNGGFLWGDRKQFSDLQSINYYFQTIPTTLDANGDSLVDLLGMIGIDSSTPVPACLTFSNRTVDVFNILTNIDNLLSDATQATVDLNDDLVVDLFLTIDNNNKPKFRVYQLPISNMTLITEYDSPNNVSLYHLSTFADIDADGELEHILPVCLQNDCSISQIYVRDNNQWNLLPIQFNNNITFPLIEQFSVPFDRVPISIKIADYNLDGYPDMVMIMNQSGNIAPLILKNEPCSQSIVANCTYGRMFQPQFIEVAITSATNATLVAFFDILENGYPDLLVLQKNDNETYQLNGFENSLVQDVQFIKVMVLSQFSCNKCSHQEKLPYGNDQPGQLIKMETLSSDDGISDDWVKLTAVQMAHSGQFSLELPYAIIGLGTTPNFVEKVTVAIPPNRNSIVVSRTFTQMIPNSQIVIIPYPLTDPDRWKSRLFIIPSRMILHTGLALGATLIVIAIVLIVFQYREKIEDDRERKVQSQRFHYDAL